MKKTIALLFLLAFAGLSFYFFFAEDYCPVHCRPAQGGSLNHVHHPPASICLCFWSALDAPGSCDFFHYLGAGRLPAGPFDRPPLRAFDADISHPPEFLPA